MSVTTACKGSSLFLQPCCSTFIFNQVFKKLAEGNRKEMGGRNSFSFFSELQEASAVSPGSLPGSLLGSRCVKTQLQ